MPIGHELLETLCCPVARSPLRMMTKRELAELNSAIVKGRARYASGVPVAEALESALATADGVSAYGIRDGVPVLLPDLRIDRSDNATRSAASGPAATQPDPWADRWGQVSMLWSHINAPVRPTPQDTALLERLVDEALAAAGPAAPRALLLGVTPEIATMRWPSGTRLLAVDYSEPMIRNVWPAHDVPDALVVRADWTRMPVREAAYDVVIGDGSANMPGYPDGFNELMREVRRVLKDDGTLAMRVFARPEEKEPIDTIFADLRGGRIGNIDIFYWRLAMAVHGDLESGCRMGDIWEVWNDNVPEPRALMRSLGWPLEAHRPFMDGLRGLDARMTFPTIRELVEALTPDFGQTACHVPDYETGDRYPTVVFKPRPR